jgi:hypothetical protein
MQTDSTESSKTCMDSFKKSLAEARSASLTKVFGRELRVSEGDSVVERIHSNPEVRRDMNRLIRFGKKWWHNFLRTSKSERNI